MALPRTLLRVAAGLLLLCAAFAEITKDNGVLVLTDDNFQEALDKYPDGLLVEMYAPWCGHCKALAPEYEKAAKELEGKDLFIAKLDATEHKEAAGQYEVEGFPTIKYITKNKAFDYGGGRTAEDIVKYVVKKSGPSVVPLASKDAVDTFADGADAVVVGFFHDPKSKLATLYSEVASGMDDFSFGVVNDKSVTKAYGASDNTLVLLKKYDEGKVELSLKKDASFESVSEWVSGQSMRLLTTFSQETARLVFGGSVQVHTLLFMEKAEGEIADAARTVAKDVRGKMLMVHVPPTEERVLEFFDITAEDLPRAVIADMREGMKKYILPKETKLEAASLKKFAEDFFAGKLKPTLKSEEPEDADVAGDVKVVKGKSFGDIVINNDNNVFVKFHAPWCGHCKALAPTWEELGKKLKDKSNVVIAKMDATANEVDAEGVDVQGFPTLLFFPAGDKANPVSYDGERELDEMLDWIEENAKTVADSKADAKDEL